MWKDVNGFEGRYQVDECGNVKSLMRLVNNGSKSGMTLHERILKQRITKNGYAQVYLRDGAKTYAAYVHRIVALAFLGQAADGKVINHKDGNKQNNCVSNLEYVSYGENNQHAIDTGLRGGSGERHYNAKLTRQDVEAIRAAGKISTYQSIAEKYGVSRATIRDVLLERTWAS